MRDENGLEKCVACGLCAVACPADAIYLEEIFGPVLTLQTFETEEEALALADHPTYGLCAGVYTRDQKRARKILSQVRAGSVYWNCCDRVSPRLPWSGIGHSGIGLTLSRYGIQTFTRAKAWHLRGA